MSKLFSALATTLFLGSAAFAALPTIALADDCRPAVTTHCETVVDQSYGGGGHNPDVVPIRACLSGPMFRSIQLRDGTSAWEVGFYYGNGRPEVVRTVRNDACWTHSDRGSRQHGAIGAWVVAYIDCDHYRGWVGGEIGRSGQVDLRPIRLPAAHDPMQ